jgi:DNA-binding NarL/FixJ family response regulator
MLFLEGGVQVQYEAIYSGAARWIIEEAGKDAEHARAMESRAIELERLDTIRPPSLVNHPRHPRTLSTRELEVLQLLVSGLPMKSVARRLATFRRKT